jgi:hypothetical protein
MRTLADVATTTDAAAQAVASCTTFPPFSSNRNAGIVWYTKVMSQARAASSDCARFAAGLGE